MNNNKFLHILLIIFGCLLLTLLTYALTYPTHPSQLQSSTELVGGCDIKVVVLSSDTALVKYTSSNSQDSYEQYVEIEYPDPDLTTEEELSILIQEAVQEMQQLCEQQE